MDLGAKKIAAEDGDVNNNRPIVPVFTLSDLRTRGSESRLAELQESLSRVKLDGSRHGQSCFDSITYKIKLLSK